MAMVFILALALAIVFLAFLSLLGLLFHQARRMPTSKPQYVALGSSFAAGIGLGKRAPNSPLVCMRSSNGYPQQLARLRGLSLVDMTCSGATAMHVLRGGQMFLGPQVDALSVDTELVTMTVGGNDIHYVSDLSFLAARDTASIFGWLLRRFWKGPLAPEQRDYTGLRATLVAILTEIRRRAPRATVVILSYPRILPAAGPFAKIGISEGQATAMRMVGDRLADITRIAACDAAAIFLDLQTLGAAHHACSEDPWVNGWVDPIGTQFHPTIEGSRAIAAAIASELEALSNER